MFMEKSVVIIGAGPGGLTLALTLAQFGIKPIIVEKKKKKSLFTKALSMQPRTLEIMDSLSILRHFLDKGNQIKKNNFHVNGSYVGVIDFEKLPSKCNYLLSITQPETEHILEAAPVNYGIDIHWGKECVDVEIKREHNLIRLKNSETGEEETVLAKYVIAADGGKSTLRDIFIKKHVIQLTHETRYQSNFIMGDFAMEHYPYKRDERNIFFKNKMICVLIPMIYPDVRVVAFGLQKHQDSDPTPDEFAHLTEKMIHQKLDFRNGKWLSRFYPSRFMVSQFRIGNVFFIGDAAHIISPIGAQGINLSIEDGFNLGWKLGMLLQDKADPAILDTYQVERMHATRVLLDQTNLLHNKLSNSFRNFILMQELKMIKIPKINEIILHSQTQFFIDYPTNTPISIKQHKDALKVGSRMINAPKDNLSSAFLFDQMKSTEYSFVVNLLSKEWRENESVDIQRHFEDLEKTDSIVAVNNDCDSGAKLSITQFTINANTELHRQLENSPIFLMVAPDKYIHRSFSIHESTSFIKLVNAMNQKKISNK